MTELEAKNAETLLRKEGYAVEAARSPLASVGWEMRITPTSGGRPIYAFSYRDLRMMLHCGMIAKAGAS